MTRLARHVSADSWRVNRRSPTRQLLDSPSRSWRRPGVGAFWLTLVVLVAVYAGHEVFGFSQSTNDEVFGQGLNDLLLWAAAGACFAGAVRSTRSRAPWFLVAAGLASWAIGDTIWGIRFGGGGQGPLTSVSDVFWLAWYPLVFTALVLLVRDRVPTFELHRWIDGVVVMLIIATPWVAVFLQPVAAHSSNSALADAVDFAYPLGDAIVVGATLGAIALMGWRPGRMWIALGLGLVAIGLADAIYSVEALQHSYRGGIYDAAWAAGAILVASAAWFPHPGRLPQRRAIGWPAVALPLAAQVLAIGIQVYGIFEPIPSIERGLTIVVLLIATVQIAITRPRADAEPAAPPPTPP